MDANNELLQAIGQMMDSKLSAALEPINARLDKVDSRLDTMQADVSKLNQRVATVESKVLHELGVIREGVEGLNERNKQLDAVESKVDDHDHRIWALEQKAI